MHAATDISNCIHKKLDSVFLSTAHLNSDNSDDDISTVLFFIIVRLQSVSTYNYNSMLITHIANHTKHSFQRYLCLFSKVTYGKTNHLNQ